MKLTNCFLLKFRVFSVSDLISGTNSSYSYKIRILVTVRKKRVATNIYRNIIDNIMRKLINAQPKKRENDYSKKGTLINLN